MAMGTCHTRGDLRYPLNTRPAGTRKGGEQGHLACDACTLAHPAPLPFLLPIFISVHLACDASIVVMFQLYVSPKK